jgi:hypothetical protein
MIKELDLPVIFPPFTRLRKFFRTAGGRPLASPLEEQEKAALMANYQLQGTICQYIFSYYVNLVFYYYYYYYYYYYPYYFLNIHNNLRR